MAEITVGTDSYTLEQGDDGYWYYRTDYDQHFGKKVMLKNDKLIVWNSGACNLETGALGEIEGGTGSIH